MVLNNILLRPGLLDSTHVDPETRLGELFLDTASRLIRDMGRDRQLIGRIFEAAQDGLSEFFAYLQTNGMAVLAELQTLIAPIFDTFKAIGLAAGSGNIDGLLAMLAEMIPRLLEAADAFTVENVTAKLKALARIVDRAVGLSNGMFMNIMGGMVERISDRLMVDYLEGDQTQLALDAFQIGNNLRQMRALVRDLMVQLDLRIDLEAAVDNLAGVMTDRGWDDKIQSIKTTIETAGGGATAISQLLDKFSGSFSATVATGPNDPVSWYGSWFNDEWFATTVGVADRFNVTNEPWFSSMAFKDHSYATMENTAHAFHFISDYIEAILHGISIAFPPKASNIMHLIIQALRGTYTLGMAASEDQDAVDAYRILGASWFEYLVSGFGTIFTSFSGSNMTFNGHNFLYFLTSFLQDSGELMFFGNYTFLLRELVLTSLTLDNTDATLAASTRNHEKIMGLALLFADAGSWLGASFSTHRFYGFSGWVVLFLILGIIPPFAMAWFAPLIAQDQVDQNFDQMTEGVRNRIIAQTLMMSIPKWFMYWNILWEGNSNGGRYGGFLGYPPKDNSPYKMPFAKDVERRCVQANMGLWSHNTHYDQVYSFDFTHDFRDEVLAMRDGSVSEYWDYVGDNRSQLDNRIEVDHDAKPDPVHDREQSGTVVRTQGQYLHGSHFGVYHAFAARGIPERKIKHFPVKQGEVIMLAGNTGVSGHNHLHVDVTSPHAATIPFVFKDGPGAGTLKSYRYFVSGNEPVAPIARNYPKLHPDNHRSTDFGVTVTVLRIDADRILAPSVTGHPALRFNNPFNGAQVRAVWAGNEEWNEISSFTWDRSNSRWDIKLIGNWLNTPPNAATVTIVSKAKGGGGDHILLDNYASKDNDAYVGCHILVWWTENGREIYQYRKITAYLGSAVLATVDRNWDAAPPRGANFRIGSKLRSGANTFQKKFTHWALYEYPAVNRNVYNVANVQDFSPTDERYRYASIGHYQRPFREGNVAAVAAPNTTAVKIQGTNAPANFAEVEHRFIAIYNPAGLLVSYQAITGYTLATLEVQVAAQWGEQLTVNHRYAIGGKDFDHAAPGEKHLSTYWAPVNAAHEAQPFPNGRHPSNYLPYKETW